MIHLDLPDKMSDQTPMACAIGVWLVLHNKPMLVLEDANRLAYWIMDHHICSPQPKNMSELVAWLISDAIGMRASGDKISPYLKN